MIDMQTQLIGITEFPLELKMAVEGLNNENRQKIVLILNTTDKMSFSEIMKETNIESSLLSNHLKKLLDTLLIEHFYEHIVGEDKYSFYKISKYGKRLLRNMFGIFYVFKRREITFMRIVEEETAMPIDEYSEISDTFRKESESPTKVYKIYL
jgi:DNA-binding transcriptional ArsR family regulator